MVDIAKGGWDLEINSNSDNALQLANLEKSQRYFRLQVENKTGVIANISSIFAQNNISIEALIQHEAKSKEDLESIPVVIVSGEITQDEASSLQTVLEDLKEVISDVKNFRIHSSNI